MVEAEFEQIWQQLEQEAAREDDPEAARKEIEAERDDYRAIAERRVRLGLLLSEIGQANAVEVSQQEMQMLVAQASQQYRPEDRQRFAEYVQSDPMIAAQLRAPLYEDKVVDFLFDKAEVTERQVRREELQAAIEAEETSAPAKKPAGKKSSGKKAAPAAAPEEGAANSGDDAQPVETKSARKAPAAKAADAPAGDKPAKKPAAKKPAKKAEA
jgi:trigger factor